MFGTTVSTARYEPSHTKSPIPAFNVGIEYGVEASRAIESLLLLLYTRGYHKAAATDCPAFERLVGGICWLLQRIVHREESDDGRVQWNLLFQSHDKLKPRLGLVQQVVQCVQWLSAQPHVAACPTAIQPHQLLLQDFSDIGAVRALVYWLLDLEEDVTEHRLAALQQANRNALLDQQRPHLSHQQLTHVVQLQAQTAPRRQWQWTDQYDVEESEDVAIQRCLFEYGERLIVPMTVHKRSDDVNKEEETDIRSQLMAQLRLCRVKPFELKNDVKIKKNKIESSFDAQYERMKQLAMLEEEKRFEKQHKLQVALLQQVVPFKEDARNLEGLNEQREQLTEEQNTLTHLQQQYQMLTSQRVQVQEYARALEDAIASLRGKQSTIIMAEQDDAAQMNHLSTLRNLVTTNERLKQERLTLQSTIVTERAQLEHRLSVLHHPGVDSHEQEKEESLRYQEIEDLHADMKRKYDDLRLALAQQTRIVYHKTSRLESLPTPLEVVQYEKRIVELVDQVALILEETRKYYSTYNTLKKTLELVERERRLMDSIYTSIDQALQQPSAMVAFFEQLEAIITSIKGSVETQKIARSTLHHEVEKLEHEYEQWLEKERLYVSAIRECQKECQRQEKLMTRVEVMSKVVLQDKETYRKQQENIVVGPDDVVI